ncbi:hypothetical protein [Rhodanobacter sp. MP7CTX1]|jgi:hypothetical protein|uniref:hypothetical protein n=1 Tax=Rhodanobacter sp. MP7CTX1 TaxID=2723084 RepID=UPI0017903861|nr:hypothetical protein [Rhodanobacter sp. MP7CTX1]MBB6187140.1 hypothetical protein [Rhodanobacter sp. MP7CTX1]
MMPALSRLTLATIITGLLVGCAHQPAPKAATPPISATAVTGTTTSPATAGTHHQHHATPANGHITVEDVDLPERTGIPVCDDYLASYMACHQAAAIFSPDQLPARYQAMRTSLLLDSENPDIRPQLAARCNSLASQLREALHGKSCAQGPAPASSAH